MKKILSITIAVFIGIGVLFTGIAILRNNMLEDSRKVADSVISFYTVEPKIADDLNEVMTNKLTNYLKGMQERDNAIYTIDITPIEYNEEPSPEEFDPDAPIEEVIPPLVEQPGVVTPSTEVVKKEDTKNIEVIDQNKIAIKVNDLVFSENGVADVVYKGVPYTVYIQDVPETYQMVINNPVNNYKYLRTEKGVGQDKNSILVFYKSVVDNTLKVVKVKHRLFSLWDFAVE